MKKRVLNLFIATSLVLIPAVLETACATHHKSGVAHYGNDSETTTRVQNALYADPIVRGADIKVLTIDGVVQLTGFTGSLQSKERAGQIAASVPGVVTVHNDLLLPTGR